MKHYLLVVAALLLGDLSSAQLRDRTPTRVPPVSEVWVGLDGGSSGAAVVIDSAGLVHSVGTGSGNLLKTYTQNGVLLRSTPFLYHGFSHMVLDPMGDLILVGRFAPIQGNRGLNVMKVRTDGTVLWEWTHPGVYSGLRVATNPQGEIYVVGRTPSSSGVRDYATVKLASDGTWLWQRNYSGGSNSINSPSFLEVAPDGRVAVTGTSTAGASSYDAATVVYDTHGSLLWVARYEGPDIDEGDCVQFDRAGNVYISGTTHQGSTSFDYLLVKYNSVGVEQWVRTYDGPLSSADYARRLAVTSTGDVVVVGDSGGLVTVNSAILKYDSSGNLLWLERHSSGTFSEIPREIARGRDDAIYITADGGASQTSYSTFCYESDGRLRWEAIYESGGTIASPRSIAIGVGGAVAVTGRAPFTTVFYRELP